MQLPTLGNKCTSNSVQDRFNITLHPPTLHFLYLSTRHYVLATTYPHFTLLGQSLGSLILALDAFNLLVPDIFIDTMGYSFTLWLSKLLFPTVPTAAYVHYPTISTDMLQSLDSTSVEQGVNAGAGKGTFGTLKKKYWHVFAYLYTYTGANIDVVMTNSSWTQTHIRSLWGPVRAKKDVGDITVVFPPVAVEEMEECIPVSEESEVNRLPHLLYIAQFRPEKNHQLIVHSFAKLLSTTPFSTLSHSSKKRPKLVLVGSVRDDDDKKRVYNLRLLANELQIKDDVEFVCDASWPQVLGHLGSASVGVNGMWNEHFGIGVVEYQAAGLISVVNDSGGPRGDIVVDIEGSPTGKLSPLLPSSSRFYSYFCIQRGFANIVYRIPCLNIRTIRYSIC
jgi:alpha-1,2-mannosyltransferase